MNVATVDTLVNLPTIVTITDSTTVDMFSNTAPSVEPDHLNNADMSTVDTHTQLPTVDRLNAGRLSDEPHIVKDLDMSTVDTSTAAAAPPTEPDRIEDPDMATVAMSPTNEAAEFLIFR